MQEWKTCGCWIIAAVVLQKKSWSQFCCRPRRSPCCNLKKRLWQHGFIILGAPVLVFICSLVHSGSAEPWVILMLVFVLRDSVTVHLFKVNCADNCVLFCRRTHAHTFIVPHGGSFRVAVCMCACVCQRDFILRADSTFCVGWFTERSGCVGTVVARPFQ